MLSHTHERGVGSGVRPGPSPRLSSTGAIAGAARPASLGRWAACLLAVVALVAFAGCVGPAPAVTLNPGEYTVAVTLSGGSGKASVQSPTKLVVTPDGMTADIVWSSPYFTWMEVGGTRYEPTSQQGENSAFEIPITLDADVAVTAETVAMSTPHAVDYTLRFDRATVKSA